MTPAAIIEQAAADGVTLALSPAGTIKVTGDTGAVQRWQAILREHKPAIVAALREAANDPGAHRHWMIRFPDLDPIEAMFSPAMTLADALAAFPGAVTAEPVPETPRRAATAEQAAELRELVALILADGSEQDRTEALAVALADPDAALLSFRMLAESPQRTHGSSAGAPYAMKSSSPL